MGSRGAAIPTGRSRGRFAKVLLLSPFIAFWFAETTLAADDPIAQLPCNVVTDAAIGRQRWDRGQRPFGIPMAEWTKERFAALKARHAACSGPNPPRTFAAASALLDHLANMAPGPAPVSEDELAERRFIADIEQIPIQADSVDAMRALAARIDAARLPPASVAAIEIVFVRRLEAIRAVAAQAREADATRASAERLAAITQELAALPPTSETLARLDALLNSDRYRLPELSFPDQNRLYTFLTGRRAEISGNFRALAIAEKCTPLLTDAGMPADLAMVPLLDRQRGVPLAEFLCGALVGTGAVSMSPVGPAAERTFAIEFANLTFTVVLGRYLADGRVFFPPSSPATTGQPALLLTGLSNAAGEAVRFMDMHQGGPVVTHFFAEYAAALSAFLREGK